MDLNLVSLGTLVTAPPYCVWYSDLISLTQIHIGDTGTNRLTHTYQYILTPPVMFTQQLPVLH